MATIEEIQQELAEHEADDRLLTQRLADAQAALVDFQQKDAIEDASYAKQISDLKALVEQLQGAGAGKRKTRVGSSQRAGESIASMVKRLPAGFGARMFYGLLSSVVSKPAGCGWIHGSFKPTSEQQITPDAVRKAVASLAYASCWHEIDVKARAYDKAMAEGKTPTTPSKATMLAMSNAFAQTLESIGSPVSYVLVVGYWALAKGNTSKQHRLASFNGAAGKILGIDVDGADATPTDRDWLAKVLETGELVAFLKANPSFEAVSFPEWGDPRHPNDPDGERRSAVLRRQMAALPEFEKTLTAAVGRPIRVEAVNVYEYNRGDAMRYYAYDKPAEVKAVGDVITASLA